MVQAPACVYLPHAPGPPAIRREILGADEAGNLYWLEGKCPLGFAWGPRWWLVLSGHTFDAGFEFVPWVRYALTDERWGLYSSTPLRNVMWELVDSLGRRRPFDHRKLTSSRAIEADGSLLTLNTRGLLRFTGGTTDGQPLVSSGDPPSGLPEDLRILPSGRILEVEDVTGSDREERRRLILIEREHDGRELTRRELFVPGTVTGDRRIKVFPMADGYLLIHAWQGEGLAWRARVYQVPTTLGDLQLLNEFPLSSSNGVSIAVSADGKLFTDGASIYRVSGQKVQDLEAPLSSCVWVGRDLYGVRRHPFFAALVTWRSESLKREIAAVRVVPGARWSQLRKRVAEGKDRVATSLGFDEAGREDEIVKVPPP
jgi:hypothetical protein